MKSNIFTAILITAAILAGCAGRPPRTSDAPVLTTKTGVIEMSPLEAKLGVEAAYSQFIDVRTPEEYASGHAYRARNIPLDKLRDNLDRLDKNEPVYLICETGNRSKKAAEILEKSGFTLAISITDGTAAWRNAGLRMEN